MTQNNWDRIAAKNQLRWTGQKLGQLQEKIDSQGNITRRDISTLLQQSNVSLARAKAQKLIQDDAFGDVLEILVMYTGILSEHILELDPTTSPSPVVVEAASTIIFAAPYIDVKDLHLVRDLLVHRLGSDFAASASSNRDRYVSPRAVASLSVPTPSAATLDMYLLNVAKSYGVKWVPEPRRQDIINVLSEILEASDTPIVDIPRLRQLCSRGIPDHPPWLRPRIWKLFLGILPVLKANWGKEMASQRNSYYELVRRLLSPLQDETLPSLPFSAQDKAVLEVSHQLSRTPPALFSGLADEPEANPLCPLDDSYTQPDKIVYSNALQERLSILTSQGTSSNEPSAIPEIRLEFEAPGSPTISRTSSLSKRVKAPALLSKSLSEKAHPKHLGVLGRILYIHSAINPGNLSPHIPTLLIPIYVALLEEFELEDAAHVEADTFWMFEAVVSEFSELEDEQGGNVWMKKLSERLSWADNDLYESLDRKGLNPSLPHYSYRWLAPILAQTFPIPGVLVAWDGIFARDARQRNSSPRLDFLVDICAAMLIRARVALTRLGKNVPKTPSLWGHEEDVLPPPSPLRAWEMGDAFMEGTVLLQNYPLSGAGGIDSIMQSAADLWNRRQDEAKAASAESMSLGARLKVTMWKGFTNQIPTSERSPSASDGEDDKVEEQKPQPKELPPVVMPDAIPTLTSRFATSVWKGITNQSSMEPPPSPMSPVSPISPFPQEDFQPSTEDESTRAASASSRIWNYAEKLKESDAAAAFAKASSNWRAKTLVGSWGLRRPSPSTNPSPQPLHDLLSPDSMMKPVENRRGSLPALDRSGVYSPPTRPAYFRPPRDSVIFPVTLSAPTSPDASQHIAANDSDSVLSRAKHLQDSIASLTRAPAPPKKGGPRPLLLNASSLITEQRVPPSNKADQWADVAKSKMRGHAARQDSMSSVSSLAAPSLRGVRVEYDSDSKSKRVMLNRKSVSPMAPSFRAARHMSQSSSGTSPLSSPDRSMRHLSFSPRGDIVLNVSDGYGGMEDSPSLYSPPENRPGSRNGPLSEPVIYDADSIIASQETPQHIRQLSRKKTPPSVSYSGDTSDSSIADTPVKTPSLRARRQMSRPSALRLNEINTSNDASTNSLDVPTPDEDTIFTPKASSFDGDGDGVSPTRLQRRSRKISAEGQEQPALQRTRKVSTDNRTRKLSTDSRTRKVSTETYRASRRKRESVAEEGDDEGYDDFLSAYESEESSNALP